MKRRLSILLVVLLLLSVMPSFTMAEDDKPVIVITTSPNALVTDYDDNYFTKWVEENFGCDIQWQFLPASGADSASKLSSMMAGEEDLGDVLLISTNQTILMNYGENEAIYDLMPYFDKYDSNLEKLSADLGIDLLAATTDANGSVWCYPTYIEAPNNSTKYRAWINTQWLENLDLEMPTTPDELYNVLVAFRDLDANGNGDPNDEIPMLGFSGGWSSDPTVYLISAFVDWDDVNFLTIDENGKINAAYAQEAYRDALKFINRLVEENLLASDSFTISVNQYKECLNTEVSTVGVHFYTNLGRMDLTRDLQYEYQYLPYLTRNDGTVHISYQPTTVWDNFVFCVPTTAKDPDISFKFLDFLFSNEASIYSRFGQEGVHYDKVNDPETLKMLNSPLEFLVMDRGEGWGKTNNMSWQRELGWRAKAEVACEWNGDPEYSGYKRYLACQDMLKHKPETGEYVPQLSFTADEQAEVNELLSDINIYWKETKSMFILGGIDLDTGWDNYITTLNTALHLDRYLELVQTAYDRQFGNSK